MEKNRGGHFDVTKLSEQVFVVEETGQRYVQVRVFRYSRVARVMRDTRVTIVLHPLPVLVPFVACEVKFRKHSGAKSIWVFNKRAPVSLFAP